MKNRFLLSLLPLVCLSAVSLADCPDGACLNCPRVLALPVPAIPSPLPTVVLPPAASRVLWKPLLQRKPLRKLANWIRQRR